MMISVARDGLKLWSKDERSAARFEAMVLAGLTNLRVATGQFPKNTAWACWRLIRLLEYLAELYG